MGTSEKTFNQVKAILTKLDRNIDELRDKRLHPADGLVTAPAAATVIGTKPAVIPVPVPVPGPVPGTSSRPSFGRAQPLRTDRI